MKLLRTIRLDPSDTFVFERAAEPGEWAVSGAFVFCGRRSGSARRQGARRVPRRLPRHRVARLVDAGADRRGERRRTAQLRSIRWRSALVERFGAPDLAAARAAAEEEIAFAASLCNHPHDTLVAVHRSYEDGAIREAFRTLAPARRPEAAARLLVPRSRGRGGAGRAGRSRRRSRRDRSANEGLLALLRPPPARPRRGRRARSSPTSSSRSIWRGRSSRRRREACVVERTLHAALLADPRRPVEPAEIAAIADADARENWALMIAFRDHLARAPDAGGGLSRPRARAGSAARRRCSSISSCT